MNSLSHISERLPNQNPFNASALTPLFKSKSANNSGFLAAALKAESLLLPVKGTMQLLVKSKVSLPDETAECEAAKEAKLKALADKLQAAKT